MRRVNRKAVVAQKKITKKVLRKCLLLKQVEAIHQYIIYFLDESDIRQLQKTCSYYRKRYLEVCGKTCTKANVYHLKMSGLEKLSVKNYTHLKSVNFDNLPESTIIPIIKKLARVQKCAELKITAAITDIYTLEDFDEILPYLCEFGVSHCPVANVGNLSKAIHLRKLDLSTTQVEEIEGTNHVQILDLSYTQVSNVSTLGNKFSRIRTLNLSWTNVTDVSMLGNVYELDLSNTRVSDVSALGRVHTLDISNTKVTNVSALGQVHTLCLTNTKVTDVSMLGQVHSLTFMNAENIDVSALNRVYSLDLSYSKVTDVSMLGGVHYLNLFWTSVSDVSKLTHVNTLILGKTNVTDVSALKNVHTLDISDTKVTDVSALTHVHVLDISDTPIKNIKSLKRARKMTMVRTQIKNIKIKGLKRLKEINIDNVTKLDARTIKLQGWKPDYTKSHYVTRWWRL